MIQVKCVWKRREGELWTTQLEWLMQFYDPTNIAEFLGSLLTLRSMDDKHRYFELEWIGEEDGEAEKKEHKNG